MSEIALEVSHVSIDYKNLMHMSMHKSFLKGEVRKPDVFRAVDDISFTLEKGEVLSIIGPSGSGKTTLLRCINFLSEIDSGSMILDGEELIVNLKKNKISEEALRQKRLNFGLVFQSFNLFPQYTVMQNLTLAPTLLLKEKAKKEKLSKEEVTAEKERIENECKQLLEKVGLTEKADYYPCQLSGGQCQRVAIARALALKPKILCFDEPTSALDPLLTGEVLKVIRSLKDEGRTMIIVTHEMGFAKNVSDKVIFMNDSVICEQGKPKERVENPKTEELKNFLSNLSDKDGGLND